MNDENPFKKFLVVKELPKPQEFNKAGYLYALPIKVEGADKWIVFRNKKEVQIYEYLQSPDNYKVKERVFEAESDSDFVVVGNEGSKPQYIKLVLPNKWIIEDRNTKRELEVVVANLNQDNDQLLHTLYSKTREQT